MRVVIVGPASLLGNQRVRRRRTRLLVGLVRVALPCGHCRWLGDGRGLVYEAGHVPRSLSTNASDNLVGHTADARAWVARAPAGCG